MRLRRTAGYVRVRGLAGVLDEARVDKGEDAVDEVGGEEEGRRVFLGEEVPLQLRLSFEAKEEGGALAAHSLLAGRQVGDGLDVVHRLPRRLGVVPVPAPHQVRDAVQHAGEASVDGLEARARGVEGRAKEQRLERLVVGFLGFLGLLTHATLSLAFLARRSSASIRCAQRT